MEENQITEEIVEIESEDAIEERHVPKGAIVAAVAAAGVGIAAGVKWLIGKLRDSNPDYVYTDDDDDYEMIETDEVEIVIEED